MRAVSVHVADSTGVFAFLRNGQKVDVQVVIGRGKGEGKGDTEVRTALENLTVLSVNPQPEQSSGRMITSYFAIRFPAFTSLSCSEVYAMWYVSNT